LKRFSFINFFSVTEARRIMQNVEKQANYLNHRRIDIDDFSLRVEKQLADLKSRVKLARNAAESIKISITNQRQCKQMDESIS